MPISCGCPLQSVVGRSLALHLPPATGSSPCTGQQVTQCVLGSSFVQGAPSPPLNPNSECSVDNEPAGAAGYNMASAGECWRIHEGENENENESERGCCFSRAHVCVCVNDNEFVSV